MTRLEALADARELWRAALDAMAGHAADCSDPCPSCARLEAVETAAFEGFAAARKAVLL